MPDFLSSQVALVSELVCLGLVEVPRIGCQMAGCQILAALSLDRWLLLRRPLYYKTLSDKKYLVPNVLVIGLLVTFQSALLGILFKSAYANEEAFCYITHVVKTGLEGPITVIYLSQLVFVMVMSLLTLRWLQTHTQVEPMTPQAQKKRQFQGSLKMVFYIYLSTQVVSIVGKSVIYNGARKENGSLSVNNMYYTALFNFINGLSLCANPFVYYIRNAEYRAAIRRQLGVSSPSEIVNGLS